MEHEVISALAPPVSSRSNKNNQWPQKVGKWLSGKPGEEGSIELLGYSSAHDKEKNIRFSSLPWSSPYQLKPLILLLFNMQQPSSSSELKVTTFQLYSQYISLKRNKQICSNIHSSGSLTFSQDRNIAVEKTPGIKREKQ